LFGECVNELDLAGIDMAILGSESWGTKEHKDRRRRRVHPLGAYLAGNYVKLVTHGSAWPLQYARFHGEHDYGEVIGQLPVMYQQRPEDILAPRHEYKVVMKKARCFSRANLKRYFPAELDDAVAAYYRGEDGTEYRFLRDRGRAFVEMTEEGRRVIYHRIHGARSFEGKGGIDDWVCYADDTIIGLDPDRYYCYFDEARENVITIDGLPQGSLVSEVRETASYLTVRLGALEGNEIKGRVNFVSRVPLASVYANGKSMATSIAPGQRGSFDVGGQSELVFVKGNQKPAPIPELVDDGQCTVLTVMANGFVMRPALAREDPERISKTMAGQARQGIAIKIADSGTMHQSAKTYLDFCGKLTDGVLRLWVNLPKKLPKHRHQPTEKRNNLLVYLDGSVIFREDDLRVGTNEFSIPLNSAQAGQPHLLSIAHEGDPIEVLFAWERRP
jgi:hypothetical protein